MESDSTEVDVECLSIIAVSEKYACLDCEWIPQMPLIA